MALSVLVVKGLNRLETLTVKITPRIQDQHDSIRLGLKLVVKG